MKTGIHAALPGDGAIPTRFGKRTTIAITRPLPGIGQTIDEKDRALHAMEFGKAPSFSRGCAVRNRGVDYS